MSAAAANAVGGGGQDALVRKARSELAIFTSWLRRNRARGIISEVGWPAGPDSASWNALANAWYSDADAAELWVTAWAAGPFRPSNTSQIYQRGASWPNGGVDEPTSQSSVVEAHPSSARYLRGVDVTGGSWGDGVHDSVPFSNANPGVYGHTYFFETPDTFRYLASHGIKLVRIDFKWERLQPTPGGALDPTELGRLHQVVDDAGAAGLKVVLDLHNYGAYHTAAGVKPIGSIEIPVGDFADVWSRIAGAFSSDTNVIAYGLMNEPYAMTAVPYKPVATVQAWSGGRSDGWHGVVDSSHQLTSSDALRVVPKSSGDSGPARRHTSTPLLAQTTISAAGSRAATTIGTSVYVGTTAPGTWNAQLHVQYKDGSNFTGDTFQLAKGAWTPVLLSPPRGLGAVASVGLIMGGTGPDGRDSAWIGPITEGTGLVGAPLWEEASQAAVDAIRSTGDDREIDVSGYNFSEVMTWSTQHPTAWIHDPLQRIRYDAHQYFYEGVGPPSLSYATQVARAARNLATGSAPDS